MAAMFESLQSPPEPAQGWFAPYKVYGSWCAVGVSGVLISFWKHRATRRLGFVCYAVVFALALYFFLEARTGRPTRREVYIRSYILSMLTCLPTLVHMLSM
jgi:hypothetical protein